MMRLRGMKSDGFSLIELVFAMGLLAVGMLAASQLTSMVMKTNTMARNYTTALFLAQNKMEEIKTSAYDDLATGEEEQIGVRAAGGVFHRMVRVWVQQSPSCKIVEVTVTWSGVFRRQVVLATIIGP